MLFIALIFQFFWIPLFSYRVTPSQFNKITFLSLIFASILSLNTLFTVNGTVNIFNGLFHVSDISAGVEAFIFFVGAILLLGWSRFDNNSGPIVSEYSMIILFTTIGASLLVSCSDLVSMFMSIELQSFAVYVLATLYKNSESATAAGLKYFLLGGLSSCLILLGTALIYYDVGSTSFEDIASVLSITSTSLESSITLGLLIIAVGFLFKIAAAPLHNWAPDVYDGVPTIVTSWLSTMPKISILAFLLQLQSFVDLHSVELWNNLLLIGSIFSLILGTVLGLSQTRIKRLLAYSTISHVGFLLLALAVNTPESTESFLFYLFQYSLTNVNVFMVLLAFGYTLNIHGKNVEEINELWGQFSKNPLLTLSFAICLFSMAGIPPLMGFFAKQMVLYSSLKSGFYFMSLIAIVVSVISASYYLRIIRVMYFSQNAPYNPNYRDSDNYVFKALYPVTNLQATIIALLTIIILFFMLQPSTMLNTCTLLSLSLFSS